MSVMRVYWSQAIVRPVAKFVDTIRTLPLSRHGGARNVGWDMPCENLNRDIKDDLKEPHRENVDAYVSEWDFTRTVEDGIVEIIEANRSELKDALHKKIDTDVDALKNFFKDKIGATFADATCQNGLPQTTRSNIKLKPRAVTPWENVRRTADGDESVTDFVKRHVRDKAPWHVWRSPQ